MLNKKRIGIAVVGGAAMLLLFCIGIVAVWRLARHPEEAELIETIYLDEPAYTIEVYEDHVEVFSRELRVWNTAEEGTEKIDQVLVADANNDGEDELVILFWRYGDYFAERDFLEPIRGEDQLSQHINLYRLEPYVDLIWGGSTVREPIVGLEECGEVETVWLCAQESTYEEFPEPHSQIRLLWNGWGFEVTKRSENAIIQT